MKILKAVGVIITLNCFIKILRIELLQSNYHFNQIITSIKLSLQSIIKSLNLEKNSIGI